MYRILRNTFFVVQYCLMSLVALSVAVQSATLTPVDNFGENPTNLGMHLYVPDNIENNAPLLLAIHYCGGSGPAFFGGTRFNTLADQYGFIIIYPSEPETRNETNCFDASSEAALSGTGSDPIGLMSMVNHVRSNYNVDGNLIFVAGLSSGGMMTNVMLALYPEVFSAGAAFAGLPFTCFAATEPAGWSSACQAGQIDRTAQAWGQAVRDVNPDYSGAWPRMQLWHGTADDTLSYTNFYEAIEQWTNVHGLNQIAASTETLGVNTRTRYGGTDTMPLVEANSIEAGTHNFLFNDPADGSLYAAEAIRFFGLGQPASVERSSSAMSSLAASSNAASSDAANTGSVSSAVVSSSAASTEKSSGGGGASSLLALLLLGVVSVVRRRSLSVNRILKVIDALF